MRVIALSPKTATYACRSYLLLGSSLLSPEHSKTMHSLAALGIDTVHAGLGPALHYPKWEVISRNDAFEGRNRIVMTE